MIQSYKDEHNGTLCVLYNFLMIIISWRALYILLRTLLFTILMASDLCAAIKIVVSLYQFTVIL